MSEERWLSNGNYHPIPNDLQYAVDNPFEFMILDYLLRCQHNTNICPFPSVERLKFGGRMGKNSVVDYIKGLEKKELISVTRKSGCSNKYVINMDKILDAIRKNMPLKDVSKIAHREYSTEEMNEITIRRSIQHPELAHKAETLLGNPVYSGKTGEKLNKVEAQNG